MSDLGIHKLRAPVFVSSRGTSESGSGAALWGMLRCAALELPSLNWRGVDYNAATPPATSAQVGTCQHVVGTPACSEQPCKPVLGEIFLESCRAAFSDDRTIIFFYSIGTSHVRQL